MARIPTVKVVFSDGRPGRLIINEVNYDPGVHVKVEDLKDAAKTGNTTADREQEAAPVLHEEAKPKSKGVGSKKAKE